MTSDTRRQQPLEASDPQEAGPYRLQARLGQGATGRVYLGWSRSGRAAAVKIISPQLASDEGFRRRLTEETAAHRQATGPGLLETVAADLAADPPWLASPHVPGVSLAEAVREYGPLPPATVRVLGAGLAEALATLHETGLVHATLQPHKVLLAAKGPRLTPFAATRALDAADPSRTVSAADGRFLAPEQARGQHVGPESDVFSLAVLLALASTGRTPFRNGPGAEALRSIVEDAPDLDGVPEPLRGLLATALAKAPQQRISPERMLHQLTRAAPKREHWLPEALAARAAAAPDRPRWLRRRTLLLAMGGAGALAAAGAATALMLDGSDDPDDKSASGGRSGGEGVAGDAVLKPVHTLDLGRSDNGGHLSYSPDGKQLAVALTDRVMLWDADSRRKLTDLTDDNVLFTTGVAYSPGGLLALGYHRKFTLDNYALDLGGITVWDTGGSEPKRVARLELPTEDKVMLGMEAVALSRDGRLAASARSARDAIGKVQVWEVGSGRKVADLVIGKGRGNSTSAARCLAFSPDGTLLAAGWGTELQGGVTLFRTDGWAQAGELPLKDTDAFGVTSVAFTPDGRTLAGSFGGLALWDVPGRRLIARIGTAGDQNQTLAVSPDGSTVALGGGGEGYGGRVALYDLRTRQRKITVPSGRSGTSDLAFHPDGRTLAGVVTTTKMLTAVQLWTVE
ncbi:serine/threonine-protein kinase [Streptomyces glaucescens]|uniref:WD40 repeat domain-containing serine/threonine protein kinase n=1 Tax=Streptomyces glaucescens TaxID=1907 RepID=UPI00344B867C